MDQPFDGVVINTRERPISSDVDLISGQVCKTIREVMMRQFQGRANALPPISIPPASPGFIGDGSMCVPPSVPTTSVILKAGLGFIYNNADNPLAIGGITGVDDPSPFKPLSLTADLSIPLQTPFPVGQDRTDIIEITYDRRLADPATRDVLDPVAGVFNPTLVNKTLAWNQNGRFSSVGPGSNSTASIGYKYGTPASPGTSVPPANTPGYVTIAQINVTSGVATISYGQIADFRKLLAPNNLLDVAIDFTLNTTSQVAPTNMGVIGPAGLQAVVVADSSFATGQFDVFFLTPAAQGFNVAVPREDTNLTYFPSIHDAGATGFINSSQKTAIETYGAPSGIKVAIGQPYLAFALSSLAPVPAQSLPGAAVVHTRFALSY